MKRALQKTKPIAKRNSFDKVFPKVKTRRKAWEGQDKDTFFREKYAHVHARQKQQKQEREQQAKAKEKENKFDAFFGDKYNPKRQNSVPRSDQRNRTPRRHSDSYLGTTRPRNSDDQRYRMPKLARDPWKELVYGTGAVLGALKGQKRTENDLFRIFTNQDQEYFAKSEIGQLSQSKGIPIVEKLRADLNVLTKNAVHNGVVLETRPLQLPDVASLAIAADQTQYVVNEKELGKPVEKTHDIKANKPNALGVYVDEVTDTHNMGAILRSAYYLGADFVVVSEKNCCKLNSSVAKTAVGALDLLPIYNAPEPLDFFQNTVSNGWSVVATLPSPTKNVVRPSELTGLLEDGPCLLVFGSEGEGLRTSLINRASHQVALTPNHDTQIDSLNVSVACALLLSKFFKPNAFD